MKSPYHYLFFLFLLWASFPVHAEVKSIFIDFLYVIELFIMGSVSLALIFIFILLLNERGRREKKISLVYEDLDQKMSVMQMMMNSVREKEKNIIKIAQEQLSNVDSSAAYRRDEFFLEEGLKRGENEQKEVFVDPRTLDANGTLKQAHLGRDNYLIAMREEHSHCLNRVNAVDDSLHEAITNAVDMSDSNLQDIDCFYQRLSELIETLELEDKSSDIKSPNQHMVEALSDIQDDFDVLLKHQRCNHSNYEGLSQYLLEKPCNYPIDIVAAMVEK